MQGLVFAFLFCASVYGSSASEAPAKLSLAEVKFIGRSLNISAYNSDFLEHFLAIAGPLSACNKIVLGKYVIKNDPVYMANELLGRKLEMLEDLSKYFDTPMNFKEASSLSLDELVPVKQDSRWTQSRAERALMLFPHGRIMRYLYGSYPKSIYVWAVFSALIRFYPFKLFDKFLEGLDEYEKPIAILWFNPRSYDMVKQFLGKRDLDLGDCVLHSSKLIGSLYDFTQTFKDVEETLYGSIFLLFTSLNYRNADHFFRLVEIAANHSNEAAVFKKSIYMPNPKQDYTDSIVWLYKKIIENMSARDAGDFIVRPDKVILLLANYLLSAKQFSQEQVRKAAKIVVDEKYMSDKWSYKLFLTLMVMDVPIPFEMFVPMTAGFFKDLISNPRNLERVQLCFGEDDSADICGYLFDKVVETIGIDDSLKYWVNIMQKPMLSFVSTKYQQKVIEFIKGTLKEQSPLQTCGFANLLSSIDMGKLDRDAVCRYLQGLPGYLFSLELAVFLAMKCENVSPEKAVKIMMFHQERDKTSRFFKLVLDSYLSPGTTDKEKALLSSNVSKMVFKYDDYEKITALLIEQPISGLACVFKLFFPHTSHQNYDDAHNNFWRSINKCFENVEDDDRKRNIASIFFERSVNGFLVLQLFWCDQFIYAMGGVLQMIKRVGCGFDSFERPLNDLLDLPFERVSDKPAVINLICAIISLVTSTGEEPTLEIVSKLCRIINPNKEMYIYSVAGLLRVIRSRETRGCLLAITPS